MTSHRLFAALLLAPLAAGGCSTLRHPCRATPVATLPTPALPLPAVGVVAVDGFAEKGPLVIPPAGLTLQSAVRAAGLPEKAKDQPTELFFVRFTRDGRDTVAQLWAVPNTELGTITLKDGDQLTFLDQVQAVTIGYLDKNTEVPKDGPVISLSTAFTTAKPSPTRSSVVLLERAVGGRTTTLVFPNPFTGTQEHKEKSLEVADVVKLRNGEAVFLEPEELPLVRQDELEKALATLPVAVPSLRIPSRRAALDRAIVGPTLCEVVPRRSSSPVFR